MIMMMMIDHDDEINKREVHKREEKRDYNAKNQIMEYHREINKLLLDVRKRGTTRLATSRSSLINYNSNKKNLVFIRGKK